MDWHHTIETITEAQAPLPEGPGAKLSHEAQRRNQYVAAVHSRFPRQTVQGWMLNAPWDPTNLNNKRMAIVNGHRLWKAFPITETEFRQATVDVLNHPQVAISIKHRGPTPQFLAMAPSVMVGTHTLDLPLVAYECPQVLDLPGMGYDRSSGRKQDNPDKGLLVGFYRADSGFGYLVGNDGVLLK